MSIISNFVSFFGYYNHSRGKLEKAEQWYRRAHKFGPMPPAREGTFGVLLLKRGDFEGAITQFDIALKDRGCKDNLRAMIRMNRAMAYFKLGDTQKALIALEDIHSNFKSLRVYQTLGYVYTAAGFYDKAEPYNLEAVEYEPDDPVILDNTGQMYLQMGEWDKAKEYCERAYAVKHISDVCYHLGLVAEHEDRVEDALAYYREALTKNIDALNDVTRDQIYERIFALEGDDEPDAEGAAPKDTDD